MTDRILILDFGSQVTQLIADQGDITLQRDVTAELIRANNITLHGSQNEIKAISLLRKDKIKSIMVLSPSGALCSTYSEIIKRK